MADDPNHTAQRAFGEAPSASPQPIATASPATGELAEWGTRATAFVLDFLFLFGVAFAVTLVAMLAIGTTEEQTVEIVAYAVGVPMSLLYAPLLMARSGTRNGQTFGKQVMGIRVVRANDERVTFWTGVVRTIVGQQLLMAVTLYLYALADYLWPLRDPQNRALHDVIAKTWVVRTAASPASAAPFLPPVEPAPAPLASPRRGDEVPVHGWLPPSSGS